MGRTNIADIARIRDDDPEQLKIALRDYEAGVEELPGAANNPRIMAAFTRCGHPEIKTEKTAWCAAMNGLWLLEAGLPITAQPVNLTARSYETWGVGVSLDEAKRGDVCVKYRGDKTDWTRHVFLYLGQTATHVIGVGGNQWDAVRKDSCKVTVASFPKSEISAIRRPVAGTKDALRDAGSSEMQQARIVKNVGQIGAAGSAVAGAAKAVDAVATGTPPAVPDVSVLSQVQHVNEHITAVQMFGEGIAALGLLLNNNPWIIMVLLGAGALWWLGTHWENSRLRRHLAGMPIARELLGLETPQEIPA